METLSDKGNLTGVVTECAAPHVPPQALAPRLVKIARAFRAKPFVPHKLFPGGHAQTIVATRRLPRYKSLRGQRGIFEPRLVEVAPRALAGVAAISPSIDLSGCADRIEWHENTVYRWSFLRSLRRRVRRKSRLHPELYDARGLWRVRTQRQFDERYTAPHGGFRDAADYYVRASSLRVIARIRVPTLIIHAPDDPIIPSEPFLDPSIAANPNVLLVLTARGGHVGFVADSTEDEDRYWAENRVVEFCRSLSYSHRDTEAQ